MKSDKKITFETILIFIYGFLFASFPFLTFLELIYVGLFPIIGLITVPFVLLIIYIILFFINIVYNKGTKEKGELIIKFIIANGIAIVSFIIFAIYAEVKSCPNTEGCGLSFLFILVFLIVPIFAIMVLSTLILSIPYFIALYKLKRKKKK